MEESRVDGERGKGEEETHHSPVILLSLKTPEKKCLNFFCFFHFPLENVKAENDHLYSQHGMDTLAVKTLEYGHTREVFWGEEEGELYLQARARTCHATFTWC